MSSAGDAMSSVGGEISPECGEMSWGADELSPECVELGWGAGEMSPGRSEMSPGRSEMSPGRGEMSLRGCSTRRGRLAIRHNCVSLLRPVRETRRKEGLRRGGIR